MSTNKNSPGFHHVAIRVYDFDATIKFYTEGLGFTRTYGWGEGDKRAVLLDTGDGNYLEVFAGGKRPHGEDGPDGMILHFALRSADVDAAVAKAVAAGARVTMEPSTKILAGDHPLEIRIAFIKGLDGEVIEFFQNETY